MTAREWLTAHMGEYPDRKTLAEACAEALGIKVKSAERTLLKMGHTAATPRARVGRGLDGFRALYDDSVIIPQAIEEGIQGHLTDNGEPSWMPDREFREACNVPVAKWRRYADDYKHLQVKADFEPPQQAVFLVDHRKFLTAVNRIYVR